MRCFKCNGIMQDKRTIFTVIKNDTKIIIYNVPSEACLQCGETTYSHKIAKKLEKASNSELVPGTRIREIDFYDL